MSRSGGGGGVQGAGGVGVGAGGGDRDFPGRHPLQAAITEFDSTSLSTNCSIAGRRLFAMRLNSGFVEIASHERIDRLSWIRARVGGIWE